MNRQKNYSSKAEKKSRISLSALKFSSKRSPFCGIFNFGYGYSHILRLGVINCVAQVKEIQNILFPVLVSAKKFYKNVFV